MSDRAFMAYNIENQLTDTENKVAGKIYESQVTVSSGEIKALATTAKELVAAPGADRVLEFISATIKYNYGTAVYTESTDDMVIEYSGGQDVSASIDSSSFIDQSNDEIRLIPFSASAMAITVDLEALKNTSLQLFIPNDNPAAGDGTLDVRVTYHIHNFD